MNLEYSIWPRKTKGFYNKNLEKIDEGAHIIDIEEILEPGRREIIDIKSEKISWLDLIIKYAFAAQGIN